MKNRVWPLIALLAIIWALTMTGYAWKLRRQPQVVPVLIDNPNSQGPVAEMEKLTFLRQFLERYFNYDSNNFWQTQTSLAFLMTPDLAEKRVREVSRLRERIQAKNFSQAGFLQGLRMRNQGFEAAVFLQITENQEKKSLATHLEVNLKNTERTLENPWGLLVDRLSFANENSTPNATSAKPPESDSLSVRSTTPLVVTFPCALENIRNPLENLLKTKITTLNVSELQITVSRDLETPVSVTASCRDLDFEFQLRSDLGVADLLKGFTLTSGRPRKKENLHGQRKQKDAYEKTIESVMGIKLDETSEDAH